MVGQCRDPGKPGENRCLDPCHQRPELAMLSLSDSAQTALLDPNLSLIDRG